MNKITKILSVAAIASVAAWAEGVVCNAPGKVVLAGMEATSCSTTMLNASPVLDATGYIFHIHTDQKAKFNGQDIDLRLYVPATTPAFKDIEALVQTAYATKSAVSVIFPNPDATLTYMMERYGTDGANTKVSSVQNGKKTEIFRHENGENKPDDSAVINTMTGTNCTVNTDLNGKIAFVHCPIQSLQIVR